MFELDGFCYFSRFQATSADLHGFNRPLHNNSHFFQVGFPDPTGFVVSMTYIIPKLGFFITDFTFLGHQNTPKNIVLNEGRC